MPRTDGVLRLTIWHRWALAMTSAALQLVIFPLAGPVPVWRMGFGWLALVPLLVALLAPSRAGGMLSLRFATLLGYLCGIVWYAGNCYWIYPTMYLYGGMGRPAAFVILILFSLYLGLYHALFALLLRVAARRGVVFALVAAPLLWVAVELARARITSFPWDQLGMSQIDGTLVSLAPTTGVYGISFVLAAAGSSLTAVLLLRRFAGFQIATRCAMALAMGIFLGVMCTRVPVTPVAIPDGALAVMLQPNASLDADREWFGDGYARHIAQFAALTRDASQSPSGNVKPDILIWPESPSPLIEQDERFQQAASQVARANNAPLIIGDVSRTTGNTQPSAIYNSANFFTAQGQPAGRYDKIHLVPFGEYIPLQNLLTFARSLTAEAGAMTPGRERVMFHTGGHTYGVFICYESIFADEVRLFARDGADVLVNISDDGWYGQTSAPWQHLNMARMRAIENHRWLLADTNSGQTVAINPRGEVVQSAPAHVATAIAVKFEYERDTTFYTRHGDVFAYAVTILAAAMVGSAALKPAPAL